MSARLILFLIMSVAPVSAFSQSVTLNGVLFADYVYVLDSPDDDTNGENGFGYRRAYLSADARLSEQFSALIRLEANDSAVNSAGNPSPFIKDLSVTWHNAFGDGHSLQFGVTSPPSFTVSEQLWGFRALEKTILDLDGIVASRDMGIVVRGPVTTSGSVRYGLMVANNSGVRNETNKHKRIYGQLEFYPGERFLATIGSDFATYPGDVDHVLNMNAFVGIQDDGYKAGLEGYVSNQSNDSGMSDDSRSGVSIFGRRSMSHTVEIVGRLDYSSYPGDAARTYVIAGVSVTPDPHVRIIPNLIFSKFDESGTWVVARVTVHAKF